MLYESGPAPPSEPPPPTGWRPAGTATGPAPVVAAVSDTLAVSSDRVVTYELFKIPPRWVLLRIETAAGVVGWGEPNLEGFSDTVNEGRGERDGLPPQPPFAARRR